VQLALDEGLASPVVPFDMEEWIDREFPEE
jgi:hypothetical protein